MRTVLLLVGAAFIAAGLLWIGQGLGLIMWPADSFMLKQTRWAYIGGATAIVGLLILLFVQQRQR